MDNQEFTPRPLPDYVRRRPRGQCIGNAVETAIEHYPAFEYAEGLAKSAESGYWFRHAWNVAADGTVIDTTWPVPGLRYVGRIIWLPKVTQRVQATGRYDYVDAAAHPPVPAGEAGIDCYTAAQQEWLGAQYCIDR